LLFLLIALCQLQSGIFHNDYIGGGGGGGGTPSNRGGGGAPVGGGGGPPEGVLVVPGVSVTKL